MMAGNSRAFAGGMGPDHYHRDGAEQGLPRSVRRLPQEVFQLSPERPVAFGRIPRLRVGGGGEGLP